MYKVQKSNNYKLSIKIYKTHWQKIFSPAHLRIHNSKNNTTFNEREKNSPWAFNMEKSSLSTVIAQSSLDKSLTCELMTLILQRRTLTFHDLIIFYRYHKSNQHPSNWSQNSKNHKSCLKTFDKSDLSIHTAKCNETQACC